ncbi:MAG TPA: sensor histidine kinase, partial [Pirellulaceae bacterium]|nr:sensor histidine kinase [Pirellulaceae bacterium]
LIAYEIHDGVVQDMTASLMFLESSRADDTALDEASREAFANGVRLLRGSIHETRRLINGLRPPVLEDEGVIPAVEALVAEMEDNAGMKIDFESDVKFRRLAPALEMAIYRIVQEGLNNVWHHSRSPRARVELIQRDDAVEILVRDWGVGFDPTKVSKRRYGLMGVRERARLLNGRADIHSVLGEGTSLKVELPLIDALMPTAE